MEKKGKKKGSGEVVPLRLRKKKAQPKKDPPPMLYERERGGFYLGAKGMFDLFTQPSMKCSVDEIGEFLSRLKVWIDDPEVFKKNELNREGFPKLPEREKK